MKLTALFFLMFAFSGLRAQDGCTPTTNFFDSNGQRSSDQTVTVSGTKLVMDDGFEVITLILGSLPDGTADFTIVNYDATPGDGEVAVTYYYYSGNAKETMELKDSGKTAHICIKDGKVIVTWRGVSFQGKANGNLTYKTSCEMSGTTG